LPNTKYVREKRKPPTIGIGCSVWVATGTELKTLATRDPVLQFVDTEKTLTLTVDRDSKAVGAALV